MSSADVVIIGGGVLAASAAYHLASRGCINVLVLERGSGLGLGSTVKATGGFRAQFSSEINVRLSLLAREKLRRFEAELGVDSGYRPYGYLFLARQQSELDALMAGQRVQHNAGLVESRAVSPAEIATLNPAIPTEDLLGGVFCPTDGFIRAMEILRGYSEGAKRLGVRFELGVECEGFRMERQGRIASVQTSTGEIHGGAFVNGAGAWAAGVAKLAGVDIPVFPLRRQAALTVPTERLPAEMPMTVFAEDWFHLRVRDGRVLMCFPDEPKTSDPFDTTLEDAWLAQVRQFADSRVPCLRDVPIDRERSWAGLYEMTPDRHPLLGLAPGMENFYLINGASGHGVMHSPALGHLLAEVIVDGAAKTFEIDALRPSRFAEGKPNPISELL